MAATLNLCDRPSLVTNYFKFNLVRKAPMEAPVVLINPFSVPQGQEEEFIKTWKQTAQLMKNEPGFIDTKLHRSLDPDARFQFINIALWESAEAWRTAMAKHETKEKQMPIEANPALYRVEVQYQQAKELE